MTHILSPLPYASVFIKLNLLCWKATFYFGITAYYLHVRSYCIGASWYWWYFSQICNYCYGRMHKFSRNLGAISKFKAPEGWHRQVLYWGPTNIMCHRMTFIRHGDLAPGIVPSATAHSGPGPSHCRGCTVTLRHTTFGRTPLDEWSAPRRYLYV